MERYRLASSAYHNFVFSPPMKNDGNGLRFKTHDAPPSQVDRRENSLGKLTGREDLKRLHKEKGLLNNKEIVNTKLAHVILQVSCGRVFNRVWAKKSNNPRRPKNTTLKSDSHKNCRLPPTKFGTGPLKLLECASLRAKISHRRKEGFIPKTRVSPEPSLPRPLHAGTRVWGV